MENNVKYNINELSLKSGVPPRGIRYLISVDLLPSPSGKGRGTYYSEAHLDRLNQIQSMKSKNLSPQEIRTKLMAPKLLRTRVNKGSQKSCYNSISLNRYDIYPGIEVTIQKQLDTTLQGNRICIGEQFSHLLDLLLKAKERNDQSDMLDSDFVKFEWWEPSNNHSNKGDLSSVEDDLMPLKNKLSEVKGEQGMSDSIFIVKNAVNPKFAPPQYAELCQKITLMKIRFGVEFLRESRFAEAKNKLHSGFHVAMYQAGSKLFRNKYNSGQLITPGIVSQEARKIEPTDIEKYEELYNLSNEVYGHDLVGIIFYRFSLIRHNDFLNREVIAFDPRMHRNTNFIEVKWDDVGHQVLNNWWVKTTGD